MVTSLLLYMSIIFILISVYSFYNKYKLYKTGIITEAKVIDLEVYSYVTPGPEYGLVYHTGYTPIIEVYDGDKTINLKLYGESGISSYKKGDVFKVIYPKNKIQDIQVYSKFGLYKLPFIILVFGVLFIFVALAVNIL